MVAVKVPLAVAVEDILEVEDPVSIRGWAMAPSSNRNRKRSLVYCIAGGGCSTAYFDLQVERMPGFSMAEFLASRGITLVAFDHPGIGASDEIPDPFVLTPSRVAECHDRAVKEVQTKFQDGTLSPDLDAVGDSLVVGLGHSMGGLIAAVQQGLFQSFDSLTILGYSGSGLPEVLTDSELELTADAPHLLEIEDQLVQLAKSRFREYSAVPRRQPSRGVFFAEDVPEAVRNAFGGQSVPLLAVCGLSSMIPHTADALLARIDVPVFLSFGDQDLVADRYGAISLYESTDYASVYLLKRSGHCHNQASSRALLWERISGWIDQMDDDRRWEI